jgi:UDP-N-acetylglucosamine acyltransferase
MNQPLAYVHSDAKIAQNVVIEPFAVIHKDVEIGEGTWIGSHEQELAKTVKFFRGR